MNIFFTHNCPIKCAQYLDTKRVSKMILETAQMLSTALREHGYTGSEAYKNTHRNHPSSIWCRTTRANFKWLRTHLLALYAEKLRRTGKGHKSFDLYPLFVEFEHLIPEGELTPFANCAANKEKGLDFKDIQPVTEAYRLYLTERWKYDKLIPSWSKVI